jgi:hypothetical protein
LRVINDEIFADGIHEIFFDEPLHTLRFTPSSIQIVTQHVNFVVFNVPHRTNVSLVAHKYAVLEIEHSSLGVLQAGKDNAVKEYRGYTLVDRVRGNVLARRLHNMHLTRLKVEQSIVLNNIKIGDRIIVGTRHSDVIGIVKSLNTGVRANSGVIELDGNVSLAKGASAIHAGMRNTGMEVGVIYAG